ncbi:hypothetical protein llap_150 [Limosa lapponica baueri]|uniref:Rna-directed dna polymerase from mobile element jockey-like n=1 Tax=Limosa lapponica baueri TaxID=1758121 RepID=A0A2I0UU68_LIMLA|nr:hypothetical protein llap_150 [Limosa lapponica baueri]
MLVDSRFAVHSDGLISVDATQMGDILQFTWNQTLLRLGEAADLHQKQEVGRIDIHLLLARAQSCLRYNLVKEKMWAHVSMEIAGKVSQSESYPGLHKKKHGQQVMQDLIRPLYSPLVRPHLDPIQLWGFQHSKDMDLLEWVQRRVTRMNRGLEHLSHEDKLRELGSFSLEKRRLWEDLIAAFQLKGAYKKDTEGLLTSACSDRRRDNAFKLKEGRFRLDIRKNFFMMRVVRYWNKLPREGVDAPSLEVLNVRLDRVLSFSAICSSAGVWTR